MDGSPSSRRRQRARTPQSGDTLTVPRRDLRLVRGDRTRAKVLDAAERLFADHGFDGVSIRDIADEAGVTLGLIGFHAGGKEELFRTILSRRVETLSSARLSALSELLGSGRMVTPKDVIAAFVEPYVRICSSQDPQWQAYARLIANMASDGRWFPYIHELYDPVALKFLKALQECLPGTDRLRLVTGFVMGVATMLSIVPSRARIEALADRDIGKNGLRNLADLIIDFIASGIETTAIAPLVKTSSHSGTVATNTKGVR